MSKIKNGGLDQYVTEPFEQQDLEQLALKELTQQFAAITFLPDPQLHSQLWSIIALWPLPNCTGWYLNHVFVNNFTESLHECGTIRSQTHNTSHASPML